MIEEQGKTKTLQYTEEALSKPLRACIDQIMRLGNP